MAKPFEDAAVVLTEFFRLLTTWDWTLPMTICSPEGEGNWQKSPMQIIAPAPPEVNVTAQMSSDDLKSAIELCKIALDEIVRTGTLSNLEVQNPRKRRRMESGSQPQTRVPRDLLCYQ